MPARRRSVKRRAEEAPQSSPQPKRKAARADDSPAEETVVQRARRLAMQRQRERAAAAAAKLRTTGSTKSRTTPSKPASTKSRRKSVSRKPVVQEPESDVEMSDEEESQSESEPEPSPTPEPRRHSRRQPRRWGANSQVSQQVMVEQETEVTTSRAGRTSGVRTKKRFAAERENGAVKVTDLDMENTEFEQNSNPARSNRAKLLSGAGSAPQLLDSPQQSSSQQRDEPRIVSKTQRRHVHLEGDQLVEEDETEVVERVANPSFLREVAVAALLVLYVVLSAIAYATVAAAVYMLMSTYWPQSVTGMENFWRQLIKGALQPEMANSVLEVVDLSHIYTAVGAVMGLVLGVINVWRLGGLSSA